MTDETHTNMKLREDDELRKLVPRATESERTELERSIRVEGLRERIVVWRPPGEETEPPVILDGHTRHGIRRKHDVDYDATKLEFGSRKEAKTWILITQLGRRNLTTAGRCEVAASLEPLLKPAAYERQRQASHRYGRSGSGVESEGEAGPGRNLISEWVEAIAGGKGAASAQAAAVAGIGASTYQRYRAIQAALEDEENPELAEEAERLLRRMRGTPPLMSINRTHGNLRAKREV